MLSSYERSDVFVNDAVAAVEYGKRFGFTTPRARAVDVNAQVLLQLGQLSLQLAQFP